MAGYHVENFGCRASRADGEAIHAALLNLGMAPAVHALEADAVVVNTCSVTAEAEATARAFLRRLRRRNPDARIFVTGCYAQRAPGEVAALAGVHAVIGNSHKSLVPALVRQAAIGSSSGFVPLAAVQPAGIPAVYVDPLFAHSEVAAPETFWPSEASSRGYTRPNLKVQDGCGNHCSFCIIPTTRGHSRSMTLQACLSRVEAFAAAGGQELVLSGVNLGRWGRDLVPPRRLEDLVGAILTRTALPRLRLSSIEPMDWSEDLLALFRDYGERPGRRLARHAHLPLQSGSDAVLRAMHRRYRPWHYAEKLHRIRRSLPDAAIGADVMVGFPGESEELFEQSYDFIAGLPFTYLHLFPFSARPGTAAWNLDRARPVARRLVEERMQRLRTLIAAKNRAFRLAFAGRVLDAVTLHTPESERRRGLTRALSDNFLSIRLEGELPANQSVKVDITGVEDDGLTGHVRTGI